MNKTFIIKLPNKSGMLLKASNIILSYNGNITRLSYNKIVDIHTAFIEVSADEKNLKKISDELEFINFLLKNPQDEKVILIILKILDIPGSINSVLKILKNYDVNISYINSQENGTAYQYFKMGLLIENPKIIKSLLDEISMFCEIMFIDCDVKDQLIDNTVFYLNFGNEMRNTLSLNQDETNVFINNSNKILQILEENNEDPFKTFDYIRKFANFVINHKGSTFNPIISKKILSDKTTLYLIEPPCGSNTYIFESKDKFLFIDSGFNCFKEEMEEVFNSLFQDFNKKEKNIILTHCDMDHCGFLNLFDCVYVSESTYNNFKFESQGKDNIREKNILHKPYVKLTQIISNYHPPKLSKLKIIGKKKNKATISKIGEFNFEDLNFEIFEGNGGHINGEIILISKEKKLLFTGDIFVNIKGFSKEQKEFNLLAPYLMTNVDTDFNKAKTCRNEILAKYKDYLICPGHGKWVYNNF